MREIKFRAWFEKNKQMMCPVEGLCFLGVEPPHIIQFTDKELKDYPKVGGWRGSSFFKLMQYTGLKDKNGKEIYEGDVVRTLSNWSKRDFYGAVELSDGYYVLKMDGFHTAGLNSELIKRFNYVVVGNIYENPELLEEGK